MSTDRCACSCPGWGVFETCAGTLEVQRCDDCSTLPNDWAALIEALTAVRSAELGAAEKRKILIAALGDLHMALGASREEIKAMQVTK